MRRRTVRLRTANDEVDRRLLFVGALRRGPVSWFEYISPDSVASSARSEGFDETVKGFPCVNDDLQSVDRPFHNSTDRGATFLIHRIV
jgi:hypothetical protein